MSIQKTIIFSAIFVSGITSQTLADVGVLDKYECHNHHETNKYHCHGSPDLAKLGGFVAGVDTRAQRWSTNADSYLFIGIAANVEYNYRWVAATASYFYMPLVTGVNSDNVDFDSNVVQQGLEAGVKAGMGVGRKGTKYYVTAGWSLPNITDKNNSERDDTLSSYYAGLGYGYNSSTLAFDIGATLRDPNVVKDYLNNTLGHSYDKVTHWDTRISLGWRF